MMLQTLKILPPLFHLGLIEIYLVINDFDGTFLVSKAKEDKAQEKGIPENHIFFGQALQPFKKDLIPLAGDGVHFSAGPFFAMVRVFDHGHEAFVLELFQVGIDLTIVDGPHVPELVFYGFLDLITMHIPVLEQSQD